MGKEVSNEAYRCRQSPHLYKHWLGPTNRTVVVTGFYHILTCPKLTTFPPSYPGSFGIGVHPEPWRPAQNLSLCAWFRPPAAGRNLTSTLPTVQPSPEAVPCPRGPVRSEPQPLLTWPPHCPLSTTQLLLRKHKDLCCCWAWPLPRVHLGTSPRTGKQQGKGRASSA